MGRTATVIQTATDTPVLNEAAFERLGSDVNELADLQAQHDNAAQTLAVQLGYEGALTVGTLEDEIRFYQQRSVEALLETGKRLLLLKQMTVHGEFEQRVVMLGFSLSSAKRFMQAAAKTSKSPKLGDLSARVKSGSVFLELITHDDDVLDVLQEMDAFDRMSASQLRQAARELKAEGQANQLILDGKNAKIDKLVREKKRIQSAPANEVLADLQKEATAIMNDALGAVRGGLRQALIALDAQGTGDHVLFMAGLVGQIAADLAALREEFNLPDVSNAADAELAAEVAEWSGS